jgi:hypothetical protein
MFFCSKCDNLYDLTKTPPTTVQKAGQISEDTPNTVSDTTDSPVVLDVDTIIEYLIADKEVTSHDIGSLTLTQFTKNPLYKKLQGKEKELIYNKITQLLPKKIQDIDKDINVNINIPAYFICKNCGNVEPIKPATPIVRRVVDEQHTNFDADVSLLTDKLSINFIPRTRNYLCPNTKCKSHDDHSLREAVMFRQSGSYRVQTICSACSTSWTS